MYGYTGNVFLKKNNHISEAVTCVMFTSTCSTYERVYTDGHLDESLPDSVTDVESLSSGRVPVWPGVWVHDVLIDRFAEI